MTCLSATRLAPVFILAAPLWLAAQSTSAPPASAAAPGSPAAPAASVSAATPTTPAAPGSAADQDAALRLSPFEVKSDADQGYLATSTMSGTRLNTSIADVPAPISVVTKQQILDTASANINDIFLYEVNTMGTGQWTSFNNDRGFVSDDIQSNPSGATRMRGLTAANVALNLFPTALPFDTYNVDSVEISRGPNSSIFGMGNTGGGVNINLAQANPTRAINELSLRGDSYGGFRGTFDFNRPVIRDRLALRLLGVDNQEGYVRKPAHDRTDRLQALITARPFASTTLHASFEGYHNANNRPNSMTPEDGVSDWLANGQPTYNPLAQTVAFANGTTRSVTPANETKLLPFSLAPANNAFTTYPSFYVDGGNIQLAEIDALPSATGTGPNNTAGPQHLLQNQTFYDANAALYPLFRTPDITNRALYDWTRKNLAAADYAYTRGATAQVELQQFFLNTPTQILAFDAGWQNQRVWTNTRNPFGNANGGKYELLVDINQFLLDGSANPYYLRPYLGASQPEYNQGWSNSDSYRGTLAYELKLTDSPKWYHWLGRHRFTGYGEFDSWHTANLGFRDTLGSTEPWMLSAAGAAPTSRNSAPYRSYVQYYVGDANGYNVDYAPTAIPQPPYTTTLRYYNGTTASWVTDSSARYDQYFMANRPNRRLLSTFGEVWQGFLLGDRVVPTLGLRHDYNRTRDSNSAINPSSATNGFYDLSSLRQYGANDWVANSGNTYSQGVVVRPLRWNGIDDTLQSLELLYNQSSSFSPGSLAYDAYGRPLTDPHGQSRDYGFELALFHRRLFLRAQQYETVDYGRGSSTINTIVQRAVRMDDATSSGDPGLAQWLTNEYTLANPGWTAAQVASAVTQLAGVDQAFLETHIRKTHGDNTVATARGKEVEIEFNPTPYWTIKLTGAQTLAFNAQMSGTVQQYIADRLPTWMTIKGPFTGTLWWTSNAAGGQSPQTWYTTNVLSQLDLAIATQGKLITQDREYSAAGLTRFRLAGLGLTNWLANADVGGAVRWQSRASIGYFGAAPDPDGVIRLYDANRPIWDSPHAFVDGSLGYSFHLGRDRLKCRVQLNVRNLFEGGHLQAVAANPDGTAWAYRIVDPREFFLTTTFQL